MKHICIHSERVYFKNTREVFSRWCYAIGSSAGAFSNPTDSPERCEQMSKTSGQTRHTADSHTLSVCPELEQEEEETSITHTHTQQVFWVRSVCSHAGLRFMRVWDVEGDLRKDV